MGGDGRRLSLRLKLRLETSLGESREMVESGHEDTSMLGSYAKGE